MLGRRLQQYVVVEKAGEGGMGVVWRARDTPLDRDVALKVLPAGELADPVRRERFAREAKAASALNHPNIVTIYEIDADARLRPRQERGSVDLSGGHDGGVPDHGGDHGRNARLHVTRAVGGRRRRRRSDVFTFGIVLYEMLTGRLPLAGTTFTEALHKLHFAEPVPVGALRQDAPAGLVSVVRRALAKKPSDRFASMADAAELDPLRPHPHIGLGHRFAAEKRDAEAEAAYRKAIALKGQDWRPDSEFALFQTRQTGSHRSRSCGWS